MSQPHWEFLSAKLPPDVVNYIIKPMVMISEKLVRANYENMLLQLESLPIEFLHESILIKGGSTRVARSYAGGLRPTRHYMEECLMCYFFSFLCDCLCCDMQARCDCTFICQPCRDHKKPSIRRALNMWYNACYILPRDGYKLQMENEDLIVQQLQHRKRQHERSMQAK